MTADSTPDSERRYTRDEIRRMHPTCPDCGSTNTRMQPVFIGDSADGTERNYMPGTWSCLDCEHRIRNT